MNAIQINVMPALRLRGSLNAVVPFDIASTPVKAAADSITKVLGLAATLIEEKGIFITNDTAAFADGDSVLRVKVAYRAHTTGL